MKRLSLAELMDAFDPIDRAQVNAPNLTWIPWEDLDYFAWKHPTEPKAFLVTSQPDRNVGLVLRLTTTGRRGMCDLCCGVDREVGSVTAMIDSWPRPRTAYGLSICGNLDCSDGARGAKFLYRMGETIAVGRRIERLQENLARFVRRVTGAA